MTEASAAVVGEFLASDEAKRQAALEQLFQKFSQILNQGSDNRTAGIKRKLRLPEIAEIFWEKDGVFYPTSNLERVGKADGINHSELDLSPLNSGGSPCFSRRHPLAKIEKIVLERNGNGRLEGRATYRASNRSHARTNRFEWLDSPLALVLVSRPLTVRQVRALLFCLP